MDEDSTLQVVQSKALSISTLFSSSADAIKSNEDVAEEIASGFSKYINFTVDKEESKFNESVEMMLTRLDEFFSLVDMVRSDTSLCLSTTMPGILNKCEDMEAIFDKIDRLEDFVNTVRENVSAMEEKVVKAEADISTTGSLVKKLTSFVSMKKTRPRAAVYTAPKIFRTSQFFQHSEDTDPSTSSKSPLPRPPSVPEDMEFEPSTQSS